MGTHWIDWGRQYSAAENPVQTPRNLDELRLLLGSSEGAIRPIGAGHSFSPLVSGGGRVVSLDNFAGIRAIDHERMQVRVGAGTRLRDISRALHGEGLAFRNLGDIDSQSIAGATATATHGTGAKLPCLSAEIAALEILRADGNLLEIDSESDPDLLNAARVSLGALGIVTEVAFNVVESHKLYRRTWSEPLPVILEKAFDLWAAHRNFEFFYIPFSGYGLCMTHDLTDEPVRVGPKGDDDAAVHDLRRARTYLGWWQGMRSRIIKRELARFPAEDCVDYNWRLLSSERNVPFREMEYHLPVETALQTLQTIAGLIEKKCRDVFFPIEVRQTAGDGGWLSPFNDGNRISVAVHSWYRDRHDFLFDLLEPVFLAAGGRPHWGKLHSLGRHQFDALYPDFGRFCDLRAEWDPAGRFLNPHLEKLFDT